MNPEEPHDEPSNVAAEEGAVIVDGPDGVAITLTPEAAIETSQRLLEGALTAQGQRVAQRNQARSGPGEQSVALDTGGEPPARPA